jgi:hypothetical protein
MTAIVLHISFRRHDIRYGRPLFGEPKSLTAHVHRKTPDIFCQCSLPHDEPLVRHPTCPPWSFRCHGKLDCMRLDPAASARSSLGPAAYSGYEQVFGPRLVGRWPRHLVVDGLEIIDSLLEGGNFTIHPRCLRLNEAFQNYSRQRRGGEGVNNPSTAIPKKT